MNWTQTTQQLQITNGHNMDSIHIIRFACILTLSAKLVVQFVWQRNAVRWLLSRNVKIDILFHCLQVYIHTSINVLFICSKWHCVIYDCNTQKLSLSKHQPCQLSALHPSPRHGNNLSTRSHRSLSYQRCLLLLFISLVNHPDHHDAHPYAWAHHYTC